MNMKLIEQYEELIECDPFKISYLWKGVSIIAYTISTISGYFCAILFHIYWYNVCGGQCFIWADVKIEPKLLKNLHNVSLALRPAFNENVHLAHYITVQSQNFQYCKYFHFVCLISYISALIMITMFAISTKDDKNRSLQNYFSCTDFQLHYDGDRYFKFNNNLYQIIHRLTKTNIPYIYDYKQYCNVFKQFARKYNNSNVDPCQLYLMIQFTAWLMSLSWIASFLIILLRIIMCVDFVLLKVKIYEMPEDNLERNLILSKIYPNAINYETPVENHNNKVQKDNVL
ncbi:PREDICTED: uncharacterized protein LOC105363035 [Ceratosolen solmsi marchali]|uniref:Uncharacterized protein LOC105363035 n=1 Tax=Ceratosolen solmsi marchali TaxID=326594 RepID=A0AAJ6YIW3_9HYME|nr:PREDICTED: uncharacterized protein LOC105363035 [Ceratosolen solmsi marchali]